jgi:hypothetical protein
VVANEAPRDDAAKPLRDDDRKRFFRPPVGQSPAGALLPPVEAPPVTRPVQLTPSASQAGLLAEDARTADTDPIVDLPFRRKSFDEILSGEFHRMTDAIPIIGRNSKGEPRRGIVTLGLIVVVVVVIGVVVYVATNFFN